MSRASRKSTTARKAVRPARKKPLCRALLLDLSKRVKAETDAAYRLADQISTVANDHKRQVAVQAAIANAMGPEPVSYQALAVQAVITAAPRTLSGELNATKQPAEILHEQCGGGQ